MLDLPLWMAKELHSRRGVEVQLPKAFQEEARRILKADPSVVDLGKESAGRGRLRFSENYYALGLCMIPLAPPDSGDQQRHIQESLVDVSALPVRPSGIRKTAPEISLCSTMKCRVS